VAQARAEADPLGVIHRHTLRRGLVWVGVG
jgi:hypothetical protein